MADSKFILYVRKFLKNPLLGRKQLSIDLIHPEMANVSKKDITDKLVKVMKVDEKCISIFGMKTKFGGGRSTGFALIYDNADAKAQYDSKTLLRRVSTNILVVTRGGFLIDSRTTQYSRGDLLSSQSF